MSEVRAHYPNIILQRNVGYELSKLKIRDESVALIH